MFWCLLQIAHDTLLQYGSTDLQALLQITGEGGAWSNPVLTALLTGQPTNPEEGKELVHSSRFTETDNSADLMAVISNIFFFF